MSALFAHPTSPKEITMARPKIKQRPSGYWQSDCPCGIFRMYDTWAEACAVAHKHARNNHARRTHQ